MSKLKHISKSQTLIVELLKELKPGLIVEEEKPLGDRLRLDIFLPDIGIGIEYHGRQHYEFIQHFHKTKHNFEKAKRRDLAKAKRCIELGINLSIVSYKDTITKELLADILEKPILPTYTKENLVLKKRTKLRKKKYKKQEVPQEIKNKQREYRKKQYKKVSQLRKLYKEKQNACKKER